jgi:radical SAM protein with 4Fe4S-binding SPASM domain
VILKVTEACNSNCYYCDVVTKSSRGGSMPIDVLEQALVRTNEYLEAHPDERIELLWHGGEPLLPGPAYYRTAWELQQRHCRRTQDRIFHSIQTNLTCFTEDFVEVFRLLGIRAVGTSYDPEPHMRGPGPERDSDAYNRMFLRALGLLERHDIGWGMIYVVTRHSLERPLDVFYFLTNLKLSGAVNFNPVLIYDQARRDVAITAEEFAEFLGAIFPVWWAHRSRFPDFEPFRSLVTNVIDGGMTLGCGDSGKCTHHHMNVAPDGEASQCGRSADWGLLKYGNIRDRTFEEILADPQRDRLRERVSVLVQGECAGCRFWELCHGGCPLDAWSKHRDFMHKSEWCEARRAFIEKYFEPVTRRKYEPRGQFLPF